MTTRSRELKHLAVVVACCVAVGAVLGLAVAGLVALASSDTIEELP